MSLLNDPHVSKPDWRHDAACRSHDPELWFADDPNHARSTLAIAICNSCPVRQRCSEHAAHAREEYGIWAGLNATERRRLAALERERHSVRHRCQQAPEYALDTPELVAARRQALLEAI